MSKNNLSLAINTEYYDSFQSNTTISSGHPDTTLEYYKTIYNVAYGLILFISMHVFVTLIIYEKTKFHHRNANKKPINESTESVGRRKNSTSTTVGNWLRILGIIGSFMCVCSCVNDLIYFNLKPRTNRLCSVGCIVGDTLFLLLDTLVYLFLWLRQFVIYKQFRVKQKVLSMILSLAKGIVLFMIIGLFAAMESLLLLQRHFFYNETSGKCDQLTPGIAISANLWTSGSIIFHIILVGLFVFPLWWYNTKLNRWRNGVTGGSRAFEDTHHRLVALIVRCLVISIVCTVTDLAAMLIGIYAMKEGIYSQPSRLLFNFNITLNVVALIASFSEWRKMLFPWFIRRTHHQNGNVIGNGMNNNDEIRMNSVNNSITIQNKQFCSVDIRDDGIHSTEVMP